MPFYKQLGNIQEQLFDELVALAANLCRVPIAFISLLEEETVWFKHATGWAGADRLALGLTLCSVVIQQQTPTLFLDLHQEPCSQINTAEIDRLGIQFYLGVPLCTAQGKPFGVLAILDQQPREPQPTDQPLLEHFAALVSILLEFYATSGQHTLPWLSGDSQIYDAILQSMHWMHTLAERADAVSPLQTGSHCDYQQAISQEAKKLATFIQQHVDLHAGRNSFPSRVTPLLS